MMTGRVRPGNKYAVPPVCRVVPDERGLRDHYCYLPLRTGQRVRFESIWENHSNHYVAVSVEVLHDDK